MTLAQLLSTLTTQNVTADLVDLNSGSVIASLRADSYAVLEDSIESREVRQWAMLSATHIKITLAPVATESTP